MPTTELNDVWFAQPAIAQSVGKESNSQLNENKFDNSTMLIDVASISQQSLKRFKELRAVEVNSQVLFPASHFHDADDFGWQFLSHAVYQALLYDHIADLRSRSSKTFTLSVLGRIQNQFNEESQPEYFFYDASSWDSRKRQDKIEAFRIQRPTKKVRDYVNFRKIRVTRQISTGNRNPIKKKGDYLSQAVNPTQAAASLSSAKTVSLFQKLSQLQNEILDPATLKDFLDFTNLLGVVFNCAENPVTPSGYQQFMIDWNSAPQPIQGATEIQALLWKWLYMEFPGDRAKYFHVANDSSTAINRKTKARSRRLEDLSILIRDLIARART